MATFLLLWNPAKWTWLAFNEGVVADQVGRDLGFDESWSTGTRKHGIVPGDRLFLLKTGAQPRGVIAAGVATSEIELAPHWSERGPEDLAPYVDVTWTELADVADPLPYSRLRETASRLPPRIFGGGVGFDEETATIVESLWASHDHLGTHRPSVAVHGRIVTHQSVLRVLRECEALGEEQFLAKYGLEHSRRFWLEHEGRRYESQAMLSVAAGLEWSDLSAEESTTMLLRRLGFAAGEDPSDASGVSTSARRPDFVPRDARVQVAPAAGATLDPDASGRGLRAHRKLENWLASRAAADGLLPQDPDTTDPPFDLCWEDAGHLTVVEVKSITWANETSQLRLGLGQVLEYAQILRTRGPVRPVLFVEQAPSAQHWASVCESAGVQLWWPDNLPMSLRG